ncbi:MAG TPA: hypothetical protein VML96_01460 [Egibacteraceae bacterium]|nr:hypothetical protein [Egibacteraceae bacterium]
MIRSKKVLAGVAVVAVLLAGAAIPALAQSDGAPAPERQMQEERRAERRAALAAGLAEELGIDEATVAAALDKVLDDLLEEAKADARAAVEQRLDAAVADGRLTQEEADRLLEAFDDGALRRLHRLSHLRRTHDGGWLERP